MLHIARRFYSVFLAFMLTLSVIGVNATPALAASAREIEASVDTALDAFKSEVKGGSAVLAKAKGVLVMPRVYKAGIGIGGQYGEGALRINGRTVDYYSLFAGSFGFQLGAQKKGIILVFMEDSALAKFRESRGYKVGVDASVAVIKLGAEGELDSNTLNKPILAFVVDQKGLMYDLSLEGAKFSRISRD